jgi:hypothetical protein
MVLWMGEGEGDEVHNALEPFFMLFMLRLWKKTKKK